MKKIQKPAPPPAIGLVEATELEVESSDEKWSTYKLEDGTVIKIKPVILECWRFDNNRDEKGDLVYQAQVQLVQTVVSRG